MWGRQGLPSVGVLVGLMVQWRVMLGTVVVLVDTPGDQKNGIDLGRHRNADSKTACP